MSSNEEDRRLIQPAQAAGGAIGGIAGASVASRLAARYGLAGASRAGYRLGAAFRRIASAAPGANTPAMQGLIRGQAHVLSRLGRYGFRGGAIGGALAVGSAAGDYLGDLAARRLTGAKGKADEYRHVSALGLAGGAAGAAVGYKAISGMRRLRRLSQLRRSTLAQAGAAGGAVAGEASGNVHDQRYAFGENLVGSDRRLTTLGKALGPSMDQGGNIQDPRRGYGSVFQRSWFNGATRVQATGNATSGSTMATTENPALGAYRKKLKKPRLPGFAAFFQGTGSAAGKGLMDGLGKAYDETKHQRDQRGRFRNLGRNALRLIRLHKRAPGQPLSDAEHKQRVEAGKASAEKRKQGGGMRGIAGAAPHLKRPGWYSRARISPDDPDFDGKGKTQDPTSIGGSGYIQNDRKPQVPKGWDEGRYLELARWSAETAKAQHERIATDGKNKRLIPEGTDPKTVKLALDHARNLALHDVGIWDYRFRMAPEAIEQLQPLWRSGFLWHARRAQANALRQGRPGDYADLRREFGKPFKDGRTYRHKTAGHEVGEPKKRFYRHLQLLKRLQAEA